MICYAPPALCYRRHWSDLKCSEGYASVRYSKTCLAPYMCICWQHETLKDCKLKPEEAQARDEEEGAQARI